MNELLKELEGPARIRAVNLAAYSPDISDLNKTCDTAALWAGAEFWRLALPPESTLTNRDYRDRLLPERLVFLTHQISCTPSDGVAWAELAGLQLEIGAPVDKVMGALRFSRAYAPFEQLGVVTRLRTVKAMDENARQAILDLYRADVDTAIFYLDPDAAAEFSHEINEAIDGNTARKMAVPSRDRMMQLKSAFERYEKRRQN